MSVRVLIIDDQDDFRRLLAHHVYTEFETPSVAEYKPSARGRLPPDFSVSAYDAVLLGDTPGRDFGVDWLRDLSRRNDFPPIIYLMSQLSPEAEEHAIHAGAHACLARSKIDHGALVAALRAAQARRGQFSRPAARVDESARATQFGDASIPVSSDYLAESERTGTPRWLQDVLTFAAALLLGVICGVLGASGRPELGTIFVGLLIAAVIVAYRTAILWFVIIGALVIAGTLQLYLPGSRHVRYVIPLASIALLLHWGMDKIRAAWDRRPGEHVPLPAPFIWALSFALVSILSVLVNLSDPAVALMGMKDYFQMWGLFIGVTFLLWNSSLDQTLLRGLLLIGLVQLPLAAHQYLFLVPKRIGLGDGIVPADVVAGSFGASLYGGGANAVLAAYLVILVGCLLALWKNGVISTLKVSVLAPLLLSPLLINGAKVSALYLPLIFVVIFGRDLIARPIKFLFAGAAITGVLALLMTAFTLAQPPDKVQSWSDMLDFVVTRQTADIGERRHPYNELSRLTVLTFWAEEHVAANPANTLIGHGLGSSRVREGGLDLAHTLAEKAYRGLPIGYTALGALLWDTGIIGLFTVLGMFVSAFLTAGWLARHYRGNDRFKTGLFEGLQAGIAVLTLSLAHKDFFVAHLPFQALVYLLVGFIAYSRLRVARGGA